MQAKTTSLFCSQRLVCVLIWLLTLMLPAGVCAQLSTPVTPIVPQIVLIEMEGTVEVSRAGSPLWDPARVNQPLLPGDRVRTGDRSRAVVRLSDRTLLRKGPQTIIEIPSGKGSGIRLLRGILYFFHRDQPRDFPVVTPACYAAIVGTEFSVTVAENGATTLHVIDGQVELTNAMGRVPLRSGESGRAAPGRAPERTAAIRAVNALQWCLYYPGILHLDELEFSLGEKSELSESLQGYGEGDLLKALGRYPSTRQPASDEERVYLAALLLGVGEVERAQHLLDMLPPTGRRSRAARLGEALRRVIAAVQLQPASNPRARADSPTPATDVPASAGSNRVPLETIPAEETLATVWLAASYQEQSSSRLEGARDAARRSVQLAPRFAFGWVRLAELEFSFGRVGPARDALERGLQMAPRNAQAHALRGFLQAAENRTSEAVAAFEQALALDGALGNAWLGRGLCRIHRGDLQGGWQDLQVASTMEPQRAALRSYLGKGFHEADDFVHAEAELNLAKGLDQADPTPWLYSALLNQQRNRINEAVRDLERSKELNDNRSVYRSRLLLDQDLAVQGANLANVYRDAGMAEVSLREAAQAVHQDYANASAHLFLAESFDALRDPRQVNLRYETPWLSEFLVASLLAPPGAGTLSPYVTQQEYGRLFDRDRFGLVSSTEYLSRGDWVQTASQYGNWGNAAYAADVVYRSEAGDRPNADVELLAPTIRFQYRLTTHDNVFLQGTSYDFESGDVRQYRDPSRADPKLRQRESQALVLAGLHHEWGPGVHTLFLAGRVQDTLRVRDPYQQSIILVTNFDQTHLDGLVPFQLEQRYRSRLELNTVELQQAFRRGDLAVVTGARFQTGEFDTRNLHTNALPPPLPFLTQGIVYQRASVFSDMERASIYAYPQWRVLDPLLLIGGLSYDHLRFPENHRLAPLAEGEGTVARWSPKAGWIWTPDRVTAVRGAYTRSLGGVSLDQSYQLEPTQVAGFLQTYRSLIPESVAGANAAPRFETISTSLERKFGSGTYLGLEGEILRSEVRRQAGVYGYDLVPSPVAFLTTPAQTREVLDFQERAVAFSANEMIGAEWSLGVRYRLSEATLRDSFPDVVKGRTPSATFLPGSTSQGLLHQLNLSVLYHHSSGFYGHAEALWLRQETGGALTALDGEDFWQFNLFGGYRFWHRRAEASIGVLNLTDRDYRLHPLNLTAGLPRDRTLVARWRFFF